MVPVTDRVPWFPDPPPFIEIIWTFELAFTSTLLLFTGRDFFVKFWNFLKSFLILI